MCGYCTDGHVVYLVRDGEDEMAPCPFCDEGKLREFPPPDSRGNPRAGVWGAEGFWKGRDHTHLRPLNTSSVTVPPPAEWHELMARLRLSVEERAGALLPRRRLASDETWFKPFSGSGANIRSDTPGNPSDGLSVAPTQPQGHTE